MNRRESLSLVAIAFGVLSLLDLSMVATATSQLATDATGAAAATSLSGIHLSTGHGDSMTPTMQPGDRALCIEWIEADVGDVVAIERDHDPTYRHRVVARNATHIVTKGDGNDYLDTPADREAVKCRVVWSSSAGWYP